MKFRDKGESSTAFYFSIFQYLSYEGNLNQRLNLSISLYFSFLLSAVFYALGSLVLNGFQAERTKYLTTVLLLTSGQMCSLDVVLDLRWDPCPL